MVLLPPQRREASPQDLPFGNLLSYGSNGKPTITVTRTLRTVASQVTSTQALILPTSDAPGLGNVNTSAANPKSSSPNALSTTSSAKLSSTTVNASQFSKTRSANITGGVLGSLAGLVLVALFFYFCRLGRRKEDNSLLKLTFKTNRKKRTNDDKCAEQLEEQNEVLREAMLRQRRAELDEMHQRNYSAPELANTHELSGASPLRPWSRAPVMPGAIGMAVSTSSPPHTPALRHTGSGESPATLLSFKPADDCQSLLPARVAALERHPTPMNPDLTPAPLRPAAKLAPIDTSPRMEKPKPVSPISPKKILRSLSQRTAQAFSKTSKILSPDSPHSDGKGNFQILLDTDGPLKTGKEIPKQKPLGRQNRLTGNWF